MLFPISVPLGLDRRPCYREMRQLTQDLHSELMVKLKCSLVALSLTPMLSGYDSDQGCTRGHQLLAKKSQFN